MKRLKPAEEGTSKLTNRYKKMTPGEKKKYVTMENAIRRIMARINEKENDIEMDEPEIHANKKKEKKAEKDKLGKHKYITFDDEEDEEDEVKKTGRQKSYTDSGLGESAPPGKKAEDWIKSNKAEFKKRYGDEKGTQVLYAKAWKLFGEESDSESIEEESNRAANRQGRNQSSAMHKVRALMKKKKAGGRVSAKEFAAAKAAAQAEQSSMTKAKETKPAPKPAPKSNEPEKANIDSRAEKRVAASAHRMMINHPTYRRHASDISGHITHMINKGKMPKDLLHKAATGGDNEVHDLIKHAHDSWKKKSEKPSISLASIKIRK